MTKNFKILTVILVWISCTIPSFANTTDIESRQIDDVKNAIAHCKCNLLQQGDAALWYSCHIPALTPLAKQGNYVAQLTLFLKYTEFFNLQLLTNEDLIAAYKRWGNEILKNPNAPQYVKRLVISIKNFND